MRPAILAVAVLTAVAATARAQDSTARVLQQARALYERIELERALPLYRSVLSPSWGFEVTQAQRVEASLYLGAALVLLDERDSALAHFRTALERDPFADLDPARFTPSQLAAFQQARQTVFAIGVRPVVATRLDPRSGRLTFAIATTHAAAVRCEIRGADSTLVFPVLVDEIPRGGLREIEWDGVLPNGQLAPSGRYAFVLLARSRVGARGGIARATDSTATYFDVKQEFPALEDTLADFGPGDLLPEQFSGSEARGDLLKGLGVAAGALFLAGVASNQDLGSAKGMATTVGVVGVTLGVTRFVTRRGGARPENRAVNERRRADRAATNAEIRRRNADRLAQTVLLISPAAGSSR
jgi:tetratricopeptide (TPR) repeat protein